MKKDGPQVIIRSGEDGKWLLFREPLEVLSTGKPAEVVSFLERIGRAVEEKKLFAAGFLAYEAAPAFDPALRVRPAADFPLLWFGLFREAVPLVIPASRNEKVWSPAWQSSVTREEYQKAIQAIKSFIVAGATYQVNYTYRLWAPFTGDAREYFFLMAAGRNIPGAALVETADYALCSFSPELFFNLRGREIISRPMKGTMPRGMLLADDQANARQLHLSEKDRAENVMIVDMMRNDLGRVAVPGTVHVSKQFAVEKYDTVWQMTSTVRAETSASPARIFQALFPPASCTGAPKVKTMQIIAELETSPRRIYTGSIGFIAPGRQAQFNVAIRTLLIDKRSGRAEYGVGGGIVWDSVDEAEYDECAVKAKIVREPAADFSLLETMRWTPEEDLFLLDLHLARLKESAAYFSFPFDRNKLLKKITGLTDKLPPAPHRIRLLLERAGNVECEAQPLENGAGHEKPVVCLAKHPVASGNPFLYHKTTNRMVYEEARRLCPGYDEVILWNEREEATEFCAANIAVDFDGQLVTPPVSCGLLPGTYRAWLLQKRMVKEEIIKVAALRRARKIYMCNSVRKMREVKLDY